MKKTSFVFVLLVILGNAIVAQVSINTDDSQPHPSAMLDIKSDNKGLLPPCMDQVHMNGISSPVEGLIVFCNDCPGMYIYLNGQWNKIAVSCDIAVPLYGNHVAANDQIEWHWNTVPGAAGYKWGTANDYLGAQYTGNATTLTQSGLTCGTAYSSYAWAYNACGRSEPVTLSQSTLPCSSTVTTTAASNIMNNAATVNGAVNANGSSTDVTFQYGLTTGYGSTVTASPSPLTGNTATPVSAAITSLTPNTLYHYRVVGVSAGGTANGDDLTFTTLPLPPDVTTTAASSITTTAATLNGTVNANGSSTYVSFQYGLTTSYGFFISALGSPVTGTTITSVSAPITGLAPNTVYHYQVGGTNTGGTANGNDMTFTTLPVAPVITTAGATTGTYTTTLNGTANANGASTNVSFQYGLTTGYGSTVNAIQSPVTGTTVTAVSSGITGLSPNTSYHYRCTGTNAGGTTNGNDMNFTTLATSYCLPSYSSGCSYGDGLTSFNLGTINPGTIACSGSPPWYHNYTSLSTTLQIGSTYTVTVTSGYSGDYVKTYIDFNHNNTFDAGEAIANVICSTAGINYTFTFTVPETALTGTTGMRALTEWLTYPAGPCNSQTYGNCCDFTVNIIAAPPPPAVTTTAATALTYTAATLNGTVNANGFSTTVTFQYGLTTGYGSTVPALESPVTGTTVTPVSAVITGLLPNTVYHYRAVGVSANGTVNGNDMNFTTPMPLSYCLPSYSTGCSSGDGLTSFSLGTINTGTINCSGSPPWYHDYTASSAALQMGVAYTITVQAGNPGTDLNVYIDYNHNNTFDPGELIGQVTCVSAMTDYTITVTVPGSALTGTTRLRTLTENGSYPSGPCAGLIAGNCCDFGVNITATPPTVTTTAATAITNNTAPLMGRSMQTVFQRM